MAKQHHQGLRVRAKIPGLYGQVREPGAEFHLTDENHFSGRWMEHVDEKGAVIEDSPLQEAYDDKQDYIQRRAAALAARDGGVNISDDEIDRLAPRRRKSKASPDASDEGVYDRDGTLLRERQMGNPLIQPGAVGHPGQDDQSRPRAFDARHEIEQDFSQPHQLKDGTAKGPKLEDKDQKKK